MADLTTEQLGYLREIMNIGAGNAATALSQMLQTEATLEIPDVSLFPSSILADFPKGLSQVVTGVRMRMVGDVDGDLLFVVPERHERRLISLMIQHPLVCNETLTADTHEDADLDRSALAELGNILVGVYLTAIHDFCGLNIYYTAPMLAVDMVGAIADEALSCATVRSRRILIENKLCVPGEDPIVVFLLMIPSPLSLRRLVDSLEQARRLLSN